MNLPANIISYPSAILLAFGAGMMAEQGGLLYKVLAITALFILYFLALRSGRILTDAVDEVRQAAKQLQEHYDKEKAAEGLAVEIEELQRN